MESCENKRMCENCEYLISCIGFKHHYDNQYNESETIKSFL